MEPVGMWKVSREASGLILVSITILKISKQTWFIKTAFTRQNSMSVNWSSFLECFIFLKHAGSTRLFWNIYLVPGQAPTLIILHLFVHCWVFLFPHHTLEFGNVWFMIISLMWLIMKFQALRVFCPSSGSQDFLMYVSLNGQLFLLNLNLAMKVWEINNLEMDCLESLSALFAR